MHSVPTPLSPPHGNLASSILPAPRGIQHPRRGQAACARRRSSARAGVYTPHYRQIDSSLLRVCRHIPGAIAGSTRRVRCTACCMLHATICGRSRLQSSRACVPPEVAAQAGPALVVRAVDVRRRQRRGHHARREAHLQLSTTELLGTAVKQEPALLLDHQRHARRNTHLMGLHAKPPGRETPRLWHTACTKLRHDLALQTICCTVKCASLCETQACQCSRHTRRALLVASMRQETQRSDHRAVQ